MIELVRLKRLLAILLALAGLAGGMIAVRGAATAILGSATGADPTSIFKDVPPVPGDLINALAWLPDPERDGRAMEPTTRVLITDSYARALSALDRAGRGDPNAPLADYLSGSALENAVELAADVTARTTSTFHLGQELRLDFYSDDGSVVAIGVPSVEIVRAVDGAAGRTIVTTFEEWRFTMLLEDGNWRIQQLQTTEVEPPEVPGEPRPFGMVPGGVNIVTIGGDDHSWSDIDDERVAADLDAAVELGFGTVRVFVAGPEVEEIDVEAFEGFLDLAAERGLNVIPVLFEGSASHHQTSWRDDVPYLEAVVGPLARHEAIVVWDLKNAPDLDSEASGGSINVDAWLTRVASVVRQLDPDTPVTVGWSSQAHAARIVNWVDVVSFQHVGDPALLPGAIDTVEAAAGGRPIVLSGFGTPEYRGRIQGLAPSAQAQDFAALLAAVDTPQLAGAAVWTLRDPVAPMLAGPTPGAPSTTYGLLRVDGSERATAAVLRDGPSAIPVATRAEQLRGQPFLLLGGVVLVLLALWAIRDRIRRRRADKWEWSMVAWLEAGMLPTRRSKLFPWRRLPIKPGRRGRILWWRRRQPWPAPDSEPIDPIGYIADQVNRKATEAAPTEAAPTGTDAADDATAEIDAETETEFAVGSSTDDEPPEPHGEDEGRPAAIHADLPDQPAPEAAIDPVADGEPEQSTQDHDADAIEQSARVQEAIAEATAAAWIEGALAAMSRKPLDSVALDWLDGELGDEPGDRSADDHLGADGHIERDDDDQADDADDAGDDDADDDEAGDGRSDSDGSGAGAGWRGRRRTRPARRRLAPVPMLRRRGA